MQMARIQSLAPGLTFAINTSCVSLPTNLLTLLRRNNQERVKSLPMNSQSRYKARSLGRGNVSAFISMESGIYTSTKCMTKMLPKHLSSHRIKAYCFSD